MASEPNTVEQELFGEHRQRVTLRFANLTYGTGRGNMKLKVIVHEAEEGGYWAEVPAIPGCATQGRTFDELLSNVHEAVEGCLSADVSDAGLSNGDETVC